MTHQPSHEAIKWLVSYVINSRVGYGDLVSQPELAQALINAYSRLGPIWFYGMSLLDMHSTHARFALDLQDRLHAATTADSFMQILEKYLPTIEQERNQSWSVASRIWPWLSLERQSLQDRLLNKTAIIISQATANQTLWSYAYSDAVGLPNLHQIPDYITSHMVTLLDPKEICLEVRAFREPALRARLADTTRYSQISDLIRPI